jgi:hypothetical protein
MAASASDALPMCPPVAAVRRARAVKKVSQKSTAVLASSKQLTQGKREQGRVSGFGRHANRVS